MVSKVEIILALILLALLVGTRGQFAACELAYYQLQEELRDIASLSAARIGMAAPRSDDELRDAVIRKAGEHDISLAPRQVTVRRSGTTEVPVVYLAGGLQSPSRSARVFSPSAFQTDKPE